MENDEVERSARKRPLSSRFFFLNSPTVSNTACSVDTTRRFHSRMSPFVNRRGEERGMARPVSWRKAKTRPHASEVPRIVLGPEPKRAPFGGVESKLTTSRRTAAIVRVC